MMNRLNSSRNTSPVLNIVGAVFGVAVMIGAAIFVTNMMADTKKDSDVVVTASGFQVLGMYGKTFVFADVTSIHLEETMPAIESRTNGGAVGVFRKGYFDVAGLGNCLLYLSSAEGPYLFVEVGGKTVILCYPDPAKTTRLYEDLASARGK
jgi:hypothetical protein